MDYFNPLMPGGKKMVTFLLPPGIKGLITLDAQPTSNVHKTSSIILRISHTTSFTGDVLLTFPILL